jgi:hypothetical protein
MLPERQSTVQSGLRDGKGNTRYLDPAIELNRWSDCSDK